jgi:hypothetical protein
MTPSGPLARRGNGAGPATLDVRQVVADARRAVSDHRGCLAPEAVRAAGRDGSAVAIWVISASDAVAVVAGLRRRGYHAEPGVCGGSDGCGHVVRVTPTPPHPARAAVQAPSTGRTWRRA